MWSECGERRLSGEMIELKNKDGGVEMIVCAVPYLKEAALRCLPKRVDRDIAKLVVEGTRAHYHAVFDLALQRKVELRTEKFNSGDAICLRLMWWR